MRISDWSSDVCSSDLKKSLFLRRIWQKKPEISKTVKQGVRIPPAPPVRYKVWHAPNRRAYAVGGEHPQQVALAAHDPDLALVHFDPLRERAKMIAPIAAALKADTSTCGSGELAKHRRRDRLLGPAYAQRRGAPGVRSRLAAGRTQPPTPP